MNGIRRSEAKRGYGIRRAAAALLLFVLLTLSGCTAADRQEQMTLRQEGIGLLQSGDLTGAAERFRAALSFAEKWKTGKTELDIYRYLAEAEYRSGNAMNAASTYGILLEKDERRAEYLDMRALCLLDAGQPAEEPLRLYDEADAMTPHSDAHSYALYAVGEALLKEDTKESLENASRIYEKAASEMDAPTAGISLGLGLIAMRSGDYETALEHFQQGVRTADPAKKNTLLFNEGCCYEALGRFDEALEVFREIEGYADTETLDHEIRFLEGILGEQDG